MNGFQFSSIVCTQFVIFDVEDADDFDITIKLGVIYEVNKMTDCGQTIDENWNPLVNYQMSLPNASNKYNNMYYNPLKGTVISVQSTSLC